MNKIIFYCSLLLLTLSAIIYPEIKKVKSTPPNIFVIMADDFTFKNLSLHGGKNVQTPNINKLALYRTGLAGKILVFPFEKVEGVKRKCVLLTANYNSKGMQEFVTRNKSPFWNEYLGSALYSLDS